jgi:TolB protein
MYLDELPAWFPDGTRIAFQSNRTGSWEIWVMNADDSGVRQLTR